MQHRLLKTSVLILCGLVLYPASAYAGEPCGPGIEAVVYMIIIAVGFLTGLTSLILLLLQPRVRKAFDIMLTLNLLIHLLVFATWFTGFDYYEPGASKLIAFLKFALLPSSNGEVVNAVTRFSLVFWLIMCTHLWWRRRREKQIADAQQSKHE